MNTQDVLQIALVQVDLVWENQVENLMHIENILNDISSDIDIIILPEAFSTGFSMQAKRVAELALGNSFNWMKHIAHQKQAVVCGSYFVLENGNYFNRFYWVEPTDVYYEYDKKHLFSIGGEKDVYTAGYEQVVIDYKGWRIMPQICYDLRFPVWARNQFNYDILLNVANWPAARNDVWTTLLKARAIENQCYSIGVNRVGDDGNGLGHCGNSMLIDAKGKIMLDAGTTEGIYQCSMSKKELIDFRSKFDVLSDMDQFELI